MYPSGFSLSKKILSGSITEYLTNVNASENQTWSKNASIEIKAGNGQSGSSFARVDFQAPTSVDRKTRMLQEDLNEERFVTEFSKGTIKNWKGLTLDHLETLILIDKGEKDPDEEIPYSEENAEVLVSNSTEFDTWLNEVVFDLDNFRGKPKG